MVVTLMVLVLMVALEEARLVLELLDKEIMPQVVTEAEVVAQVLLVLEIVAALVLRLLLVAQA